MSFANLGEHGAHRETTHFLNRTIDDRKPLDRRISTVAYAQPSKRNLYFFPFLFYFLSFFLFSLFSIRHPGSVYNIYIYILLATNYNYNSLVSPRQLIHYAIPYLLLAAANPTTHANRKIPVALPFSSISRYRPRDASRNSSYNNEKSRRGNERAPSCVRRAFRS